MDDNSEAGPPARSPKVFGILSIIFSSIMLLFSMIGLIGSLGAQDLARVGLMMRQARDTANGMVFDKVLEAISGIYDVAAIDAAIFAVMSGILLAIGIGQLQYRRWARKATISWGWAALASLVLMGLLFIAVVGPIYGELASLAASAHGSSPELQILIRSQSFGPVASAGGAVMLLLFYAPYPILLLAFFSRDNVKRAMTR